MGLEIGFDQTFHDRSPLASIPIKLDQQFFWFPVQSATLLSI